MISRFTLSSSRNVTIAFALSISLPMLCVAQRPQEVIPANVPPPPVYVNPRAGADDPRIGLKPGMHDAAEAAMGMKRLASLAKPSVFDPPPPPPVPGETNSRATGNGLTYANSDMAMGGSHLFVGNFYGISIYDIADPAKIKLTTTIVCPGGQGDVSVYGNLLFMSVEGGGRIDCGLAPFPTPARPEPPAAGIAGAAPAGGRGARGAQPPQVPNMDRIRGIRIFDISDINKPKQVAVVQTCRGSHTHTLVQDLKDKDDVYVYISGSAAVRPAEELAGCEGGQPGDDPNTALFTIVVIKVPLAHPELAKVVNSPRIFADPTTGKADGLYVAGSHGSDAPPRATSGCHDITVYPAIGLAAGACVGNGILLDISDPVHPKRLLAESDPNYSIWHSATFSNDGSKLLFTDEWGGGTAPRCRSTDPMHWGADTIFTLSKDHKLTLQSYYKMPAPQTELENCVAHNGSLVPIPGRDILAQGWYQGGISLVDFTEPTHPYEVAFFDRGPTDPVQHLIGGYWAAYWYNGSIYGSEIARGVDVFQLTPSKYLTQNEINAANQLHLAESNPQDQQRVVWPPTALTAKAYVDQLVRSSAITADKATAVFAALDKKNSKELKADAVAMHKQAATLTGADADRMHALAGILEKL